MYPTAHKTGRTARDAHGGPLTPKFCSQKAQSIKRDTFLKENISDAFRVMLNTLRSRANWGHLRSLSSSRIISTKKPKIMGDIPLPTGPRMNAWYISCSSSVARFQTGREVALGATTATASRRPMSLNTWFSPGGGGNGMSPMRPQTRVKV